MNKPQLESRKLGAWHDLIERLWRDIDPATLSPDFQDYAAARAAFADYLLSLPPGPSVPMYLDSPATTMGAKIERVTARIVDRVPTYPADLAEKAIIMRDESSCTGRSRRGTRYGAIANVRHRGRIS